MPVFVCFLVSTPMSILRAARASVFLVLFAILVLRSLLPTAATLSVLTTIDVSRLFHLKLPLLGTLDAHDTTSSLGPKCYSGLANLTLRVFPRFVIGDGSRYFESGGMESPR